MESLRIQKKETSSFSLFAPGAKNPGFRTFGHQKALKLMWHNSGQHSPPSPQSLRLSSLSISMFSIKRLRVALWNFWIYANRGMLFLLTFSLTCENSENQIKIPRPLQYSLMTWTSRNLHASMKCPQNYATGTGSHFDSSCEVSGDANWHVKSQLHSVATWILCQTSEALAYINQHTQSAISRFLQ